MSSSNVRSIDALTDLNAGLIKLADNWQLATEEIAVAITRVETHFGQDWPRYWREQTRIAEQKYGEAQDLLSRKRATIRASDHIPATEEAKRVTMCKRRIQMCQQRSAAVRDVAIKVKQKCDDLRGVLSSLKEQSEVHLPTAAAELRGLIDVLNKYADKADGQ